MKLPFFSLNFACHPRRGRRLAVLALSNQTMGLVVTIYWSRRPVFNLAMNKGLPGETCYPYRHQWFGGNIKWQIGTTTS